MNGRFIFENLEHDDKKNLEKILKEIEITAEPDLNSPLDNVFNNSSDSPISKEMGYNCIIFVVSSEDSLGHSDNKYYVKPIRTSIVNGIAKYDLRKLNLKNYRVVESSMNFVIIESRLKGQTYELGLYTHVI